MTYNPIICFRGRCSFWGKSWKYHMWSVREIVDDDNGNEYVKKHVSDECFRCGMTKEEAKND